LPHCPWQNGRIERFFGTFKRAISQIQISSKAQLQQAMTEFSFFYNHIRQHQNLGYRTPHMAWNGQIEFPKRKTPHWFAAWGGVLCGWYWGDIKNPPDD
jgi:putative transposase